MSDSDITLRIDGVPRRVPAGTTLAAALLQLGVTSFRRDSHGLPRAPLCGMGTCFECRVTVDGVQGVRACVTPVRDEMQVESDK